MPGFLISITFEAVLLTTFLFVLNSVVIGMLVFATDVTLFIVPTNLIFTSLSIQKDATLNA